jgi:hypothetical protein
MTLVYFGGGAETNKRAPGRCAEFGRKLVLGFVNSKGDLVALFLMQIVPGWNEIAAAPVSGTPQTKRLALREKTAGVASPHPPTNEHCHHVRATR